MYAVIDTETTGLSPNLKHRIIEVAVVLTDENGHVEDQWSTLLNPERDLGPQRIHQIRAKDVLDAPRFADIAGQLLSILQGRLLVAHNAPFDLLFIDSEFDRLGVPFPYTRDMGLCTMRASTNFLDGAGRSLRECCSAAGVPLTGWHSALADATAAAGLLRRFIELSNRQVPWQSELEAAQTLLWPRLPVNPGVERIRESSIAAGSNESDQFVAKLVDYMPRVDSSESADPYLAVLDQTLEDRYLSADEDAALGALAISLGLTEPEVARLHQDYLDALARIALSDQHMSDAEEEDLKQVATILGLSVGDAALSIKRAEDNRSEGIRSEGLPLEPGDMIVFTGEMAEPRDLWFQRAAEHGLIPHPSVTKKVKVVVAADPDSLSGKARKARGYGIPVMSIDQFRTVLGYKTPAEGDFGADRILSRHEADWARIIRAEMEGESREF